MAIRFVNAPQPASQFTRAGLRRGFIAALPFILSNGVAGVVMGVAYRGLGIGLVPSVLFSVVLYSATAQAVTLGMWTSPPAIPAMLVACIATNARYLIMGAHLRGLLREARLRLMLPVLFLLADASWLMTTADAEHHEPDAGYLLGSSIPMGAGWIGGTAAGFVLPLKPGGLLTAATALLPLIFIATLLPTQWRGLRRVTPWLISAAAAVIAAHLFGEAWAMLIGGGAGTIVSALRGDDE